MRIKSILYTTALLGLLLVLITGIALDLITSEMRQGLESHDRAQNLALLSAQLRRDIRDINRFNDLWLSTGKKSYLAQRDSVRAEMQTTLGATESSEGQGHDRELLDEAKHAVMLYFLALDQLPLPQSTQQLAGDLEYTSHLLDLTLSSVRRYAEAKDAELSRLDGQSRHYERIADWIAHSAEATAVVLFAVLIWFLHSQLIAPISGLLKTIIAYRDGKHDARMPTAAVKILDVREAGVAFNSLADWINELESRRLQYMIGAVHDIRNPLTVLKTISAILTSLTHQVTPERQRELIRLIDDQVDRLKRLVDDTIDTQQVQSGRFRLKPTIIDLVPTIEQAVQAWKVVSRSHEIVFSHPEDRVLARCDADRIQQTLNNLLSNAIKYSPDGGRVEVALESGASFVTISVTDRGMGISPEDQAKIFEPFKRATAVRDLIPGTGLGLSSAKKIVEAHGGTIEVESKLGIGSIFRIRLPVRGRPGVAAAA